ncbi:MAG: carbon monoxide dehydrogenase [Blastopirellula sp.]|mgnify:CR=1 FL=1|nr:carbon monoxide dehydrogenase [Blastopirellula sp.]
MHEFTYESPRNLADAIACLSQHKGTAQPLAGGTDLIDQMRGGRSTPEVLVDTKKIEELRVLQVDEEGLRLGAAVPCYQICSEAAIVRSYTALSDSCQIIGGIQIQSRATVGGNLCNAGPAADTTPSLIALGAECLIAGVDGERTVPVESFCTGPGQNILAPGELLVELRFPAAMPRTGSHYRRMIPRNEMDIAVVGVGAAVALDDALECFTAVRVGLGAVAPTPLLATVVGDQLVGQPVTDERIAAAAAAAQEIVAPITDMRGTKDYRVHVTGVLVKRVLHAAVSRARGEAVDCPPGN